jgi:hypothetical protein
VFRCGQYVHHKTNNVGAGRIIRVIVEQILADDDSIHANVNYAVRWLDQDGMVAIHGPQDLVASAHTVPSFATPEEADAWMESQLAGGGWVGNVEDTNAVVAEIVQQASSQLVAEATEARLECGSDGCFCLDCASYTEDGEYRHSASMTCTCADRGCGCAR